MTASTSFPTRLTPQQVHQTLLTAEEIAVLDVRENGLYARQGHMLFAVSAPLDRLGMLVDRLVPRRDTCIVLVDGDGSLVEAAAAKLLRFGYTRTQVMTGGVQAWRQAGLELFIDNHVPSKLMGEIVETQAHTPSIDAQTLRRYLDEGRKLVIVDGRPAEEFRNFSMPGAWNIPNAELPYRIRALAPDAETLVVVNCAGRTRSIIGAQTLMDSGVPNPVVSLEGGTMAWLLAGHALEYGKSNSLPEPEPEHLEAARQHAAVLIDKLSIPTIDDAELDHYAREPGRTLYRFDVRTLREYASGHLPGWRWAAGGQLVQTTDLYAGVRHARIVLADWDGVRALHTAAWLKQLGNHEVFLYRPRAGVDMELGEERVTVLGDPLLPDAPLRGVEQVAAWVAGCAVDVFDVDNSLAYRRRHIRGARFAAPHRLREFVGTKPVVVTSRDGALARMAAGQLISDGIPAYALLGGNQAWFEAGLPTGSGGNDILTGEDDANYNNGYALDDPEVRLAKFRSYLSWEVGLLGQSGRAGAEHNIAVVGAANSNSGALSR